MRLQEDQQMEAPAFPPEILEAAPSLPALPTLVLPLLPALLSYPVLPIPAHLLACISLAQGWFYQRPASVSLLSPAQSLGRHELPGGVPPFGVWSCVACKLACST